MSLKTRVTLNGSLLLTILVQVICLVFSALVLDTGVMSCGVAIACVMYWSYIGIVAAIRNRRKLPLQTAGFILQVRYMFLFFLPIGIAASQLIARYYSF